MKLSISHREMEKLKVFFVVCFLICGGFFEEGLFFLFVLTKSVSRLVVNRGHL